MIESTDYRRVGRADRIEPGDALFDAEDRIVYVVTGHPEFIGNRTDQRTGQAGEALRVPVRYEQDGGHDYRMFFTDDEPPLMRAMTGPPIGQITIKLPVGVGVTVSAPGSRSVVLTAGQTLDLTNPGIVETT